MQHAIALSEEALGKAGTEPFGAVVVKDGQIVGEGLNHSKLNFDPTSHGEIEAIRDACFRLKSVDLTGCEIYTSCEPCAMCVATMTIAGIERMYFGASMAQAGLALTGLPPAKRFPVDVEAARREAGCTLEHRSMPSEQKRGDEAFMILKQWASQ